MYEKVNQQILFEDGAEMKIPTEIWRPLNHK